MPAYYNENDPRAAAWLRELISEGHIAAGEVDERSITEVHPSDLKPYDQCHFFAGIGGWSYALRLAGWPDDRAVWTGSCPCQPFSAAGKGLGEADERHLWPAFFMLIRAQRPVAIFGEQVASKAALSWLDGVFADLEGARYACAAADLCAASVGAPHIRQRLYWLADADYGRASRHTSSREHQGRAELGSRSKTGGLADTASEHGPEYGQEPRRESWRHSGPHHSAERGSFGGMEHTESLGREQRWPESNGRRLACRCGSRGLGNTDRAGRCEQCGPISISQEQPSFELRGNAWNSFDILPCRDGKARRVESGTFPLAHGVSGRVGLLRGYGNAIVPQVAAEFIAASLDALCD